MTCDLTWHRRHISWRFPTRAHTNTVRTFWILKDACPLDSVPAEYAPSFFLETLYSCAHLWPVGTASFLEQLAGYGKHPRNMVLAVDGSIDYNQRRQSIK